MVQKLTLPRLVYRIIFFFNSLIIICLLLASLAWYIPPSKSMIFQFLGLGYPVWVAMCVIGLFFWILIGKWKYVFIQIVCLLICYPFLSTYVASNKRTHQKDIPASAVKFMTYNINGLGWSVAKSARNHPVFDFITKMDPDIVCLQEALFASFKNKNNVITQKEFENNFPQYPYKYYKRSAKLEGNYETGVMIMSKFPIMEARAIDLGETFNGALLAQVDVNGKRLTVVDVHLESNRISEEDKKLLHNLLTDDDQIEVGAEIIKSNLKSQLKRSFIKREKQVKLIKNEIKNSYPDYVVICGDFNDTPVSYTFHEMKKGLKDAYVESGFGLGITMGDWMFPFRIDHIMYSPNITSYNTSVKKVNYSDHYAVVSFLDLE